MMMHRLVKRMALLCATALLVVACGTAETADNAVSANSGSETTEADLPEVIADDGLSRLVGEFETTDGEAIDLASLQGNDVVFWFWAPW